jgi:SAM-dependent methyltransferase
MPDSSLEREREALLGPDSQALIAWMHRSNLGLPRDGLGAKGLSLATKLGWQDALGRFTPRGHEVSGSLREYTFWVERGRRTHGAGRHPSLEDAAYRGLSVLEVGCGFGCNLFSLSAVAKRVVGLEPVRTYREMSPLLAEREQLAPIEIVNGLAEALPFPNASFDRVICYSSHQYMDLNPALNDMARVLAPKGQLQLISGVLDQYVGVVVKSPSLGQVKHLLKDVSNTLSYQWLGRRLKKASEPGAMNAPIYPTVSWLRGALQRAGLTHREDLLKRDGTDTLVFADKVPSKR